MSIIVIAEPDLKFLHKIMEVCRDMGHQVYPVAILEEETDKPSEFRPDVIITNFNPPQEARDIIRQWQVRFPKARIIIVSGTRLDLAKEAKDLDVFDHIREPFPISHFRSCIRRACGRQSFRFYFARALRCIFPTTQVRRNA